MAFIRENIIKRFTRSSGWSKVRKTHLINYPTCEACGRKRKLEVHHIRPFHLYPKLELEFSNLITLCSHATECHLSIGHLGSFHSYNVSVVEDAASFLLKVNKRPRKDENLFVL